MKWSWVVMLVGAVAIFCAFMLFPREDPNDVCNFCSGSGQGDDCPRHDVIARMECLSSVRYHYCGQHPKDCG